jgi:hypothetical protein
VVPGRERGPDAYTASSSGGGCDSTRRNFDTYSHSPGSRHTSTSTGTGSMSGATASAMRRRSSSFARSASPSGNPRGNLFIHRSPVGSTNPAAVRPPGRSHGTPAHPEVPGASLLGFVLARLIPRHHRPVPAARGRPRRRRHPRESPRRAGPPGHDSSPRGGPPVPIICRGNVIPRTSRRMARPPAPRGPTPSRASHPRPTRTPAARSSHTGPTPPPGPPPVLGEQVDAPVVVVAVPRLRPAPEDLETDELGPGRVVVLDGRRERHPGPVGGRVVEDRGEPPVRVRVVLGDCVPQDAPPGPLGRVVEPPPRDPSTVDKSAAIVQPPR